MGVLDSEQGLGRDVFGPDNELFVQVYDYINRNNERQRELPKTVISELVVRGESDEASPAGPEGEEDLHGRVCPHLPQIQDININPDKTRYGERNFKCYCGITSR